MSVSTGTGRGRPVVASHARDQAQSVSGFATSEPADIGRRAIQVELEQQAVMKALAVAMFLAESIGWGEVVDLLVAAHGSALKRLHESRTGAAR